MTISRRDLLFRLRVALALFGLWLHPVSAQQMDPRAYTNVPSGLNFLIGGFSHSEGDVLVDPSIPIKDASAKVETGILGYARTLALWGQSGTIGLVVNARSPLISDVLKGSLEGSKRARRSLLPGPRRDHEFPEHLFHIFFVEKNVKAFRQSDVCNGCS